MSAASCLSKKRFHDIETELNGVFEDKESVMLVMDIIKRVMKFDPEASRYTPEVGKKTKEYRHKLRDEKGISTYISNGGKKRYEAIKQKIPATS